MIDLHVYMQECHEMGFWGGQTDEDDGRQLYDFYLLKMAAAARDEPVSSIHMADTTKRLYFL